MCIRDSSAGSTVYTSTSTSDNVKTVSTIKDGFYAITVINTDTEAKNITVQTDGTITKLYNLETLEEFSSDTGEFVVGVMDSYEILYLGYEGTATGLVCQMDLDENSGTTTHDLSGNSNDGTISSGASWNNDGILVTLTNLVDYTLSGDVFTIINSEYYWQEIQITYNYVSGKICNIFDTDNIESAFSSFIYSLLGFLGVMGVIIAILWLFKYLKPIFSKQEGIQSLSGS